MPVRHDFPHTVVETENVWIPLSDGTRLAARIWMPADAMANPVPAVLEYLPYRKDDATAAADARRHPYFAGHGYASVRVDIRGSGSSDGLLAGEYLPQEQDDALEVLRWIAGQPWCTGNIGMIGYSWGGFNGLQVAARRPPELKAVITHASTDDRYRDDCHYMGGCLLGSDMLKWASSMLMYTLQPPDPRFAGEQWHDVWLDRLRDAPALARDWIAHQRRDEFWKHGSICEDYSAITCPVFVVGGWADAYTNAVPRLLEHLSVPRIGLIGPWAHMIPNEGVPGPAIGFLQECVRWWDRWLKGIDNGIEDAPLLRVWMQEYVTPAAYHDTRPGRWVAADTWPPAGVRPHDLFLSTHGTLEPESAGATGVLSLRGAQECGWTAGVWCANGNADEIAIDQRPDDELSTCFTTAPLEAAIEVLGTPVLRLSVASDSASALLSARLEDIAPSGESLLVSWGLLNLTHRASDEAPEALEPGRVYDIELPLRVCGHRFAPGHRLRLALSPTYWPHAWPSPAVATLALHLSGHRVLALPRVAGSLLEDAASPIPTPEHAGVRPACELDHDTRTRTVSHNPAAGLHEIVDEEEHRAVVAVTGGLYREHAVDTYRIRSEQPLSAEVNCARTTAYETAAQSWRIDLESSMTCDRDSFFIAETYTAVADGAEVFSATRSFTVPRDHV